VGTAVGARIDPGIAGTIIGTSEIAVTAAAIGAFARATDDDNPLYRGTVPVAPPMFEVVPAHAGMDPETMAANRLDVLGARLGLHAEQEMRFLAPIRAGEKIRTEVRVEGIEEHRLGQMARFKIESRATDGSPRAEVRWANLYLDESDTLRRPARPQPAARPEPLTRVRIDVAPDQSLRYAEASGDHTRTHVDEEYARSLGFPTYLLQGLCTMAFAAKAVVDEVAAGDPLRLRALGVRFSGPVYPGDSLVTSIWPGDRDGKFDLETVNQDGVRVLAAGVAELGPQPDARGDR
jgi:acyl dehydratase